MTQLEELTPPAVPTNEQAAGVFAHVNAWLLGLAASPDARPSPQSSRHSGKETPQFGQSDDDLSSSPSDSPLRLIPQAPTNNGRRVRDWASSSESGSTGRPMSTDTSKVSTTQVSSALTPHLATEMPRRAATPFSIGSPTDRSLSDDDSMLLHTTPLDLRPFLNIGDSSK